MTKNLIIAVAQINPQVGDLAGNFRKLSDYAGKARKAHRADLIIFPELALTGYPPEDLLFREGFVEKAGDYLQQLASAHPDIAILTGLPRRHDGHLYNSVAWLVNGRVLSFYDKHALPNYGVFDEKRYFTGGFMPMVIDFHGAKIGVTICEDLWESAPIQRAKTAGAECIININASPFHIDKLAERRATIKQRCAENGLPILYLNMVGGQDELVFDGFSMASDRDGNIIYQSPGFIDHLGLLEYSAAGFKPTGNPPLDEIQTDDALIYQALVLAVRDYVGKNGFNGVVIGLSGGVDSALTLAIAVDALGAEQVEAVMMPSRYTSRISLEDAAEIARNLNIKYSEISIEASFESLLTALTPVFKDYPADITEENLQARCRGVILMAISNKKYKLVLTTGNKSEMAVGYATLYGDMAGGFSPLKDVSKTRVYQLCEYRNRLSAVIPQRIIDRPPSAELAPDQKDEDSLPPYVVLDRILELYLEQEKSPASIVAAGFDESVVNDVVKKINRNEYKRRQAAPGVKITKRAFGRERRYPITCVYE
jgi:NAD+ synthase (glutamine-hydrolysing)